MLDAPDNLRSHRLAVDFDGLLEKFDGLPTFWLMQERRRFVSQGELGSPRFHNGVVKIR
jgi:hypothetical protein